MDRFVLYTYSSKIEYEKLVKMIDSGEIKKEGIFVSNINNINEIEELENIYIDLSMLIDYLKDSSNKNINFPQLYEIYDSCEFIVKSELEKDTLNYLDFIFSSSEELKLIDKNEIFDKFIPFDGLKLFTYEDNEFEAIIKYFNDNKIPFTNFNKLRGGDELFKLLFSIQKETSFIDITSIVSISKGNSTFIYFFEQIIDSYSQCNFLIKENVAEDALKIFSPHFTSKEHISKLIHNIKIKKSQKKGENEKLTKITDLKLDEFAKLLDALNSDLIGHDKFKKRFQEKMEDFRILNKVKISKIFSILLLGDSGLGKTEFARIIKRELNSETLFTKVNFGNYSADNSLNSLIGSPRGYIGSEDGELSLKINKSKAGIILCDEFEKATSQVFNFFLELLEDGKFTDSQSEEYDLDGYIIVFTTNLRKEEFSDILPNELQSRLDLVFEFLPLNDTEKNEFIKYQTKQFLEKLGNANEFSNAIEKLKKEDYLQEINVNNVNNLREIKRIIHEFILEKIKIK